MHVLEKDIEEGEMVGFGYKEFFSGGIGFLGAFFGSEKDGWDCEHGNDYNHFHDASESVAHEHHSGQGRIEGKLTHGFSHGSEVSAIVKRL